MGWPSVYQEGVRKEKRIFLDLLQEIQPYASIHGGLEVSQLDRERNVATRWRPWLEVRDNPHQVANINQRLIGLPEVVFDIDPAQGEDAAAFLKRMFTTANAIRARGLHILGVFSTGSRGIHIHSYLPGLQFRGLEQVRKIKLHLLKRFGADVAKATPRCMIALEGERHWKTGRPKVRV